MCIRDRSYLGMLQDAFMLEKAIRYDIKGKHYINTPSKYYFGESESSDLNQGEMMRQIFHVNGLYQHIRKRCVIYKRLTWVSVVIKIGRAHV